MVKNMDINTFIIFIGFISIGLILKSFLPKYMEEKGKNLATKEDIKEITKNTEEVKEIFNKKIAEFSKELELKLHLEQLVYDNKFKVIQETLQLIDSYISWLQIKRADGIVDNNVIREKITSEELTLEARKCYNNLCITCNQIEILTCFNKIMVGSNENIFDLYNEFRNLCRKELKINNQIEFDKDNIFYAKISTYYLENNSSNV